MEELQQTLKSMRKVTDDVNSVTEDIRLVSGSEGYRTELKKDKLAFK